MSADHGHRACPIEGCLLALVQIEGIHLSPICPAHGSPDPICNEYGVPQSECPWYCAHRHYPAESDWCPRCEAVREYDGEVCVTCGRVWGDGS